MDTNLITICDDIKDETTLAQELYKLKEEVNDILADQNDINESTRMQLDAISIALAELQAKPAEAKPRKPIGFIQPEENDEEDKEEKK